jgi:hypothetical protein
LVYRSVYGDSAGFRARLAASLQLGALRAVAGTAQELDVGDRVSAAAADRDHVVEVQLNG